MGDLLSVLPNKEDYHRTGLHCLLPLCDVEWVLQCAILAPAALVLLAWQMSRCSLQWRASISFLPILRLFSGVFWSSSAIAYSAGCGRMSQIALQIQPFDDTAPNRESP